MSDQTIREVLQQTFADHQLSRGERQALKQWLAERELTVDQVAEFRNAAFDVARSACTDQDSRQVLDWLHDVLKAVQPAAPTLDIAESHFSPGDTCARRIISLFDQARQQVDVCVFTITDDRIASAILAAHQRGVALRIVTDNEKMYDPGSDIQRLEAAGIPLRVDITEFHMHHKFALFDRRLLLTGSYNWTRGAAEKNEENFVITGDRRLLQPFAEVFECLWRRLAK